MHRKDRLPLLLQKIALNYNPDVRRCLLLLRSRCVRATPGSASWEHHLQAINWHNYGEDRGSECAASHFSPATWEMRRTDSLEKVEFPFRQHKYNRGIGGRSIYHTPSDARLVVL